MGLCLQDRWASIGKWEIKGHETERNIIVPDLNDFYEAMCLWSACIRNRLSAIGRGLRHNQIVEPANLLGPDRIVRGLEHHGNLFKSRVVHDEPEGFDPKGAFSDALMPVHP